MYGKAKSFLAAPISIENHDYGVISLAGLQCNLFDARDELILSSIAQKLAAKLRFFAEERRAEVMVALHGAFRRSTSLNDLKRELTSILERALPSSSWYLRVVDEGEGVLKRLLSSHPKWSKRDQAHARGEGVCGLAWEWSEPIIIHDLSAVCEPNGAAPEKTIAVSRENSRKWRRA